MACRFRCRRVVLAVLLAALAVLPNATSVSPAVWYYSVSASEVAWVQVYLPMSPRSSFDIDVPSLESAKAVASAWETYRRLSLVFAAVGGLFFVRELLPIPR